MICCTLLTVTGKSRKNSPFLPLWMSWSRPATEKQEPIKEREVTQKILKPETTAFGIPSPVTESVMSPFTATCTSNLRREVSTSRFKNFIPWSYLLNVCEKSSGILVPVVLQRFSGGIFAAGKFNRDFETICVKIIVVLCNWERERQNAEEMPLFFYLHATIKAVPIGTIGDSIGERCLIIPTDLHKRELASK